MGSVEAHVEERLKDAVVPDGAMRFTVLQAPRRRALLVHQALQVLRVHRVLKELRVHRVLRVRRVHKAHRERKALLGIRAQLVSAVQLVHKALLVWLAHRDSEVSPGNRVRLVHREFREQPVLEVSLAARVHQDLREPQEHAVRQDHKAHRVYLAHRVSEASKVSKDFPAKWVHQVSQDPTVHLVLQEPTVSLDRKGQLDQLDQWVHLGLMESMVFLLLLPMHHWKCVCRTLRICSPVATPRTVAPLITATAIPAGVIRVVSESLCWPGMLSTLQQ